MSAIILEHGHYQVHAGLSFIVSKTSLAVANAGSLDIRFKTGTNKCHMSFDIAVSGKANILIYKPTTQSAGTALTVYNSNENSVVTTTATVTHTPVVTTLGTYNILDKLITVAGGVSIGGAGTGRNEIIFKANTEYLIRITNTSGGAIDISNVITFYEEA